MSSSLQTVSSENGPMTEMLGLFATAVNKMSEAIDNLGTERSAAPVAVSIPEAPADAGSPALHALEARLNAQADELRRLQQENASLRAGQDSKPSRSFEDEDEEHWEEESQESEEDYDEDDYSPEADGSLLESLLDQDEDDGLDLFLDVDFDQEDEDDEDQDDEESDEDDEDEDEDGDEVSDDLEEDEDDILSSFYSFANELKTMNVFEKMRFDGRTVETISFQDLEGLVRDQQERKRKERLNAFSGQGV